MSSDLGYREFHQKGVDGGTVYALQQPGGWEIKDGKSRGCKDEKGEVVEDKLPTCPQWRSYRSIDLATGDSNNLEGLGFHGIKLSKM